MRGLRPTLLLLLCGCLWYGLAVPVVASELPIAIEMAATVPHPSQPGMAQSYLSLVSTDGQPHRMTLRMRTNDRLDPAYWTFRAWWLTEGPLAEAAHEGLLAEQKRLRQLDHDRWKVIAALGPALWPIGAAYGSFLAHPLSAEQGMDPWQDPFPALYHPVPEMERNGILMATNPADATQIALVITPLEIVTPLPGRALLLDHAESAPASLTVETFDGEYVEPPVVLQPRLTRRYGTDSAESLAPAGWHLPGIQQIEHLLTAWNDHSAANLTTVGLPGDLGVTTGPAEVSKVPIQVTGALVPRWWTSGFVAIVGSVLLLIGGWFLAPPHRELEFASRFGALVLGWAAGWAVSVAGFPILGLGFLGGAVVTAHVWARLGLGKPSWGQWLGIVGFWMLTSALCWPLFLTQGLLD